MVQTIGILITNYHAWHVTEKSVTAVLEHGGDLVGSILVVDDCSDAPPHWSGDQRVRIHRNPTNCGYARSVNIGIGLIEEDIIVLLDCDARLLTPFVSVVQTTFASDDILAALGFIQTDDTGLLRPSAEICPFAMEFVIGPAFWNRLPMAIRDFISPPESFLCIHSCCMALRRKAFNEIGGFDDSFDFLDADMDFSIRLNRQGWRTSLTSEVICFHPGGGSPQSTTKRVVRLHHNRWKLLVKHGLVRMKIIIQCMLVGRHALELVVLMLQYLLKAGRCESTREKLACRRELLRGVWSGYASSRQACIGLMTLFGAHNSLF